MKLGYTLSSEEQTAPSLVEYAARAEYSGYDFLGISDHFAPWTHTQGNSPFSWTVIGAISQVTTSVEVFVEVVCPIMRYHPAIVAQAAATAASLLEGRFSLGVGTGEYLNEHIVAKHWPHINQRREMLAEAIDIIQKLWTGEYITHSGKYYQLDTAKIYSLPNKLPPIVVSGFGANSIKFAGQYDGLVSIIPDRELVKVFDDNGGKGKPKYGQLSVCYDPDKDKARETAFKYWPNTAIEGQLASELRLPAYFEQAAKMSDEVSGTAGVVLGDDVDEYIEAIAKYHEAGYDHVYLHQIGPNQREFLDFSKTKLIPAVNSKFDRNPIDNPRKLAFREQLKPEVNDN